jgi:pyrimidine-nucleoside phosphorylase
MVSIGKLSGRKVIALLSDMNQPLGCAVGNALEVKEAIDTLQGKGPQDFLEHCLTVASNMLLIGEKANSLAEGRRIVERALKDGSGWQKFRSMVINQGGDVTYADDPEKMVKAPIIETIVSPVSGYLEWIDAKEIGETTVDMGAGRKQKEDQIDLSVGVIIHHKVGDKTNRGDALFTVHAHDQQSLEYARKRILAAHKWNATPQPLLPLFY